MEEEIKDEMIHVWLLVVLGIVIVISDAVLTYGGCCTYGRVIDGFLHGDKGVAPYGECRQCSTQKHREQCSNPSNSEICLRAIR